MPQKQYTKEELESRYRKLPPTLQDALFSVEVADKIFETGRKYGLEVRKISLLAEETGYVILGLTPPREFIPSLVEALGMPADKIRDLAKEINHQIFYPLREELKKTHQAEISGGEIEKAEPLVRRPLAPTDTNRVPTAVRGHEQAKTETPIAPVKPPAPTPPFIPKPESVGVPGVIPPPTLPKTTPPPPPSPPTEEEILPTPSLEKTVKSTPPPLEKGGVVPPPPPPSATAGKGEEKVVTIPKIPQREPLIPPELATSPKIPPIDLRIKNYESRITDRGAPASAPIKNHEARSMNYGAPIPPAPPSQNEKQKTGISAPEQIQYEGGISQGTTTARPTILKPSAPETSPPGDEEKPQMKPVESTKRKPYGGFDPYREPTE